MSKQKEVVVVVEDSRERFQRKLNSWHRDNYYIIETHVKFTPDGERLFVAILSI